MGAPLSIRTSRAPVRAHLAGASLDELRRRVDSERLAAAGEAGRAEGEAAALASLGAAWDAALERLEAQAERAREEVARDAVVLAVEIASQLVKLHVQASDYDLERIVRSALDDSGVGRGSCVVHLNPGDHARLAGVVFRAGTVLESDAEMAPGDVHVQTPRGLLVRDLDAALDSIREQLLEDLA